ncbi:hypothetical protein BDB01DRAFT_777803 [Pilobolus umbonatus]|nr:hypothetical protein BDB01DRAFT_777803 [Pilobolus umbonatus]
MDSADMDIDLDVDEAELQHILDMSGEVMVDSPPKTKLVAEEPVDRFAPAPRFNALFLLGVDDMSTDEIKEYCNTDKLLKVEWINDSSCNLVLGSFEEVKEIAKSMMQDPTNTLDHTHLLPVKPFIRDGVEQNTLFIRQSTDEDIKVRGARERSRYYALHGVRSSEVSSRTGDEDNKKKNGERGDVFSRLGKKVERNQDHRYERRHERRDYRQRSVSPARESTRRSLSPLPIPERLKSRLGPLKTESSDIP